MDWYMSSRHFHGLVHRLVPPSAGIPTGDRSPRSGLWGHPYKGGIARLSVDPRRVPGTWSGMTARVSEGAAKEVVERTHGYPFCKVPTVEEVAERDDLSRETGFETPTCDEVLLKYVQEGKYLDRCMEVEGIESPSRCLEAVANVHGKVSGELANIARGKGAIYRAYDWWDIYGDEMSAEEKERHVADVRKQAADGTMGLPGYTEAGEEEFGPEILGGTSWGTQGAFYEVASGLYFEAKNPPMDAINVPHTYFVNSMYDGEESGIEIKVKRGARIQVTLHHEAMPARKRRSARTGKLVLVPRMMAVDDAVVDKPVTFMGPGAGSR